MVGEAVTDAVGEEAAGVVVTAEVGAMVVAMAMAVMAMAGAGEVAAAVCAW
jgi:hypothetical protein